MQATVPTILLPELLSFSPHFLLDDIINIANDAVGRALDAMEGFLVRWADARAEEHPEWDGTQELEQGLVAFQTLLEFHTDTAFDIFEIWSLRNIFAIPADLPLVAPHHEGLNLDEPPAREAELIAEIDELRRKIDNQRRLRRLFEKGVRASARQAERAQKLLDRLGALQGPHLETLNALPADLAAVFAAVAALPPHDLTNADVPLPDPGKRQWETGKAGYLNWAIAQLLSRAKRMDAQEGEGSAAVGAVVEDAYGVAETTVVKDALDAVASEKR
ncbi:Mis12-domain-containing protein [Artomyces pyxidatus]|uniref:Mis12-domain-containing protein n=1 Tax=Artomyces pyxidatus TaxID=48021 RepID=A0ACB8SS10_9AGAM|nr:Mis12-domain-containing protein [Artomyces pyxidatus]